jgi:hypothetical protein
VPDEIDVLRQFRDETPGPSTDAWLRARSAIAAASIEGQPAVRGRRHAGRVARPQLFAAAAAAAAAIAVVAALLAGSPGPTAQQIQTAAYVTRIEHALDDESGLGNLVGYTRTEYSGGLYIEAVPGGLLVLRQRQGSAPGGTLWRVSSVVRWSFQNTTYVAAFSASGRQLFTEMVMAENGYPVTVAAIYPDSTWWRSAIALRGEPRPAPAFCSPGVAIGAGGWPQFIRNQLSCGAYTLAGRQQVDGVDAVKITGNDQVGLQALWVDPKTYLPVRVISQYEQTDFRWLSPTASILAGLKLTVPRGFREIRPPSSPARP